jgi:type II secretory pathway component GspD/PulD (secretin)
MTFQTIRHVIARAVALALCGLTLPVLAQTGRPAGGGAGGGGGGGIGAAGLGGGAAGRTGTSSAATTSPIDRPGNGQVGSANFYVDKDTGQVFVIADDETTKHVQEVVSALSKPKPQVLIKVVFLEVTYNKGSDIGWEGGITKRVNATTTVSASNLFGLASQGINPTSGINTLPGAGLYSVVGNDFSATLRAIAEVGKVEVLSRPTILARNNQMATIQVGDQVPLITSVNFTALGTQENGIQYTTVGIILQVTPFITADGMVEMILAPQISSVDQSLAQTISFTTNGIPITAPAIAIESANTVVVTPDGQTVVIGGLMRNQKTSTDSKIPIIGDIPGLGLLFHHKTESLAKQELIMLLTPYVVRTPADLARMSQDERGRAPMAPHAFNQQELNQYLESGEPKTVPPNTTAPPPVANPPRQP